MTLYGEAFTTVVWRGGIINHLHWIVSVIWGSHSTFAELVRDQLPSQRYFQKQRHRESKARTVQTWMAKVRHLNPFPSKISGLILTGNAHSRPWSYTKNKYGSLHLQCQAGLHAGMSFQLQSDPSTEVPEYGKLMRWKWSELLWTSKEVLFRLNLILAKSVQCSPLGSRIYSSYGKWITAFNRHYRTLPLAMCFVMKGAGASRKEDNM